MDIVFLSEFTVNPGQFRTLIHSHLSILIDSPPPDSLYRLIHINKVTPPALPMGIYSTTI